MSTIYTVIGFVVFWAAVAIILLVAYVLLYKWLTKPTGYPYCFYEWHFKRKPLAGVYAQQFKDPESHVSKFCWNVGYFFIHWGNALGSRPARYQKLWWAWACNIYMDNRCPKVNGWSGNIIEQNLSQAERQLSQGHE